MKIKIHKHLDQKIWDETENIVPKVSDMLMSIAWAYIDFVRTEHNMNIRNCDVFDIFVFGSITQLFYDKQSDIDMCIVLNLDGMHEQFPGLDIEKQLKLYYYDWAMVHICRVYGRKIDLNFQDVKDPKYSGRYRRGPIYSLLKKDWIFRPLMLSKPELKELEKEANNIYDRILQDYKTIKKRGFQLEEMKQFYSNILMSKRQSLENNEDQIMQPVYMAIRHFKHNGYINKLSNKAIKKETNKYVLK